MTCPWSSVTRQLAAWGPGLSPPQQSLEDQEWQEVPQVGWGWAGVQGGVGRWRPGITSAGAETKALSSHRSFPSAASDPRACCPARVGPRNSHRPLLVSRRALHPLLRAAGGERGRGPSPGQPSGATVSPQTVKNLPAMQEARV